MAINGLNAKIFNRFRYIDYFLLHTTHHDSAVCQTVQNQHRLPMLYTWHVRWDMIHVALAATDLRHTVVDDSALLREGCAHPAHHAPRPRLPVRLGPETIEIFLQQNLEHFNHIFTQTYTISFFSLGHLSSFLIVFVTPNLRDSKKYLISEK